MITVAHLSDPHLAPMPSPGLRRLLSKRMLGFANWHRSRKHVHDRRVADLMVRDIAEQRPDQIVVTGDLVNISLEEEFHAARAWLQTLGTPEIVSVVPGNHDAYVPMRWEQGMGIWHEYMSSNTAGSAYVRQNARFPFVRAFGHVALVGLSSGVPKPPFIAAGRVGADQRTALAGTLGALGRGGYFRIVLIHHPPLPGQNRTRKALDDAREMQSVLQEYGAELILHGHNHTRMSRELKTVQGIGQVIGVPSASATRAGHRDAAQYNLYRISEGNGNQGCEVTVRAYDSASHAFTDLRSFSLPTGDRSDDKVTHERSSLRTAEGSKSEGQ